MSAELLQRASAAVDSNFAAAAAQVLDQPAAATAAALNLLLPAVLGALVVRAASDAGVRSVLAMLELPELTAVGQQAQADGIADASPAAGRALARALFGRDTLEAMATALEASTGLDATSGKTLIALALPRILGAVKHHVRRNQLMASDVQALLAAQRPFVESALDARWRALLEIGTADASSPQQAQARHADASAAGPSHGASAVGPPLGASAPGMPHEARKGSIGPAPPSPRRRGWQALFWIAPVAALVGWVTYLLFVASDAGEDAGITSVATTEGTSETRKSAAIPTPEAVAADPVPSLTNLQLPDGTQIAVPANGSIAKLVAALERGAPLGGPGIELDGLHFNMGSATLEPASRDQIDRLASVLKGFGSATVAIEAFTDRLGDAEANRALSQQRAESVKSALVLQGVADTRIKATGHGAERPGPSVPGVPPRPRQRRIEIVIVER